jgi:hypothetical protein
MSEIVDSLTVAIAIALLVDGDNHAKDIKAGLPTLRATSRLVFNHDGLPLLVIA